MAQFLRKYFGDCEAQTTEPAGEEGELLRFIKFKPTNREESLSLPIGGTQINRES